jgi:hypothetical protein
MLPPKLTTALKGHAALPQPPLSAMCAARSPSASGCSCNETSTNSLHPPPRARSPTRTHTHTCTHMHAHTQCTHKPTHKPTAQAHAQTRTHKHTHTDAARASEQQDRGGGQLRGYAVNCHARNGQPAHVHAPTCCPYKWCSRSASSSKPMGTWSLCRSTSTGLVVMPACGCTGQG